MRRLVLTGVVALGLGVATAAGVGVAVASPPPGVVSEPDDDAGPDTPLSGTALERAVRAALDHVGGGTVTETETGDDGAAHAVEIRTPDGRHVEVELDGAFAVVGVEADDDG